MNLREGENILSIYHHHFLPFFGRMLQLALTTIPIFFLLYIAAKTLSGNINLIIYAVTFSLFFIIAFYISLIYWLDKLIITNQRIVFVNWKLLTAKIETETEIRDIQDVRTNVKGLLSLLPFFDFGEIEIQTASYTETIKFEEAPNPDEIKTLIHSVRQNHFRNPSAPQPDRAHAGLDTYDIMAGDGTRTPIR